MIQFTLPQKLSNRDDLTRLEDLGFDKKLIDKGKVIMKSAPTSFEVPDVRHRKQVRIDLKCGMSMVTETDYHIWVEPLINMIH